MDFNSTSDYATGQIVEFHLRALRVLRGDNLSSALAVRLMWRTLRFNRRRPRQLEFRSSGPTQSAARLQSMVMRLLVQNPPLRFPRLESWPEEVAIEFFDYHEGALCQRQLGQRTIVAQVVH